MFAGPNGSGKSTVKSQIPPRLTTNFINADEIEAEIRRTGGLSFAPFGLGPSTGRIRSFFRQSALTTKAQLGSFVDELRAIPQGMSVGRAPVDSYLAAITADMIRRLLLEQGESFSFETVMSSRDKIDLLREARQCGYRTYLYYVSTENPEINIARVRYRVSQGGHPVPEDKIRSRYARSLSLVREAIQQTNRAYFFDTSGAGHVFFARIDDGRFVTLTDGFVPHWFDQAVLCQSGTGSKSCP